MIRALRMLLTLRCHDSSRLMSQLRDEPLPAMEAWAVRLHHLSCRSCRRLHRQFAFLEAALRRRSQLQYHLSPDARRRIGRAIVRRYRG